MKYEFIIAIIGSGALFGFIQFLIQRRDHKSEQLDSISEEVSHIKEDVADVKDEVVTTRGELESRIEFYHVRLDESLEMERAISARIRILAASDEIRHHTEHSKEWFDQLNEDITNYEKYCLDHPDFKNNRAVLAIETINQVYKNLLLENNFLT